MHAVAGDGVGNAYEFPRGEVVAALGGWKSFITIVEEADGSWVKAGDVRMFEAGGRKYLRTDGGSTESDALGSLL